MERPRSLPSSRHYLAGPVACWQTDDFWQYALFAADAFTPPWAGRDVSIGVLLPR